MNDDFKMFLLLVGVAVFIGWTCSAVGAKTADQGMKQQAVDAGKAMWVLDQKTRNMKFVWK